MVIIINCNVTDWSSEVRSFVMRSLNPCPENFDQNVVVCEWRVGNYTRFNFQSCLVENVNCISAGGGGVNHVLFSNHDKLQM